jgi:hypothetical protein
MEENTDATFGSCKINRILFHAPSSMSSSKSASKIEMFPIWLRTTWFVGQDGARCVDLAWQPSPRSYSSTNHQLHCTMCTDQHSQNAKCLCRTGTERHKHRHPGTMKDTLPLHHLDDSKRPKSLHIAEHTWAAPSSTVAWRFQRQH